MTHSHVAVDAAEEDGLSAGHRFWFGLPVTNWPTRRTGVMAADYLISTAEDLGRYLSMFLTDGVSATGERIVSTSGVRTMLRNPRTRRRAELRRDL